MKATWRPKNPTHPCLVDGPHGHHDWWYTAWGGGHQMRHGFDPIKDPDSAALEKGLKKWFCPGKD
jgi:hypothetical protein